MNKKIRILAFLIMIMICLSGCEMFEQKEDIFIMFTNDVASEVQGEIGYAGVKGYKDYLSSENSYVTLVDAGDFFDGYLSTVSKGEYIVSLMNAVGYDVVALGNQEFSIGLDALATNIEDSNFDYVSCNLKYIGEGKDPLSKVQPYVIKRYGWTKVAFIGVTTPETLIEGKQAYEAICVDGSPVYSFYEGDEGLELYEQVQKTIDKVRKKVDYVIVLAHLGANSVTDGFSSYDLIDNTSGIDVVIDAHSHTVIPGESVYDAQGNNVVLTSTGEKLENFGVLQLHTDHSITTTLYSSTYERDTSIDSIIDAILEEIDK